MLEDAPAGHQVYVAYNFFIWFVHKREVVKFFDDVCQAAWLACMAMKFLQPQPLIRYIYDTPLKLHQMKHFKAI